jgi:hypothetical protein
MKKYLKHIGIAINIETTYTCIATSELGWLGVSSNPEKAENWQSSCPDIIAKFALFWKIRMEKRFKISICKEEMT